MKSLIFYRGIPNQVRRLIDTLKSDPVSLTHVTEFDMCPNVKC